MFGHIITARTIGYPAYTNLSIGTSASILGVTSQGVFLITEKNHVLFLTDSSYRGPLTINLQRPANYLMDCTMGEVVYIDKMCIQFSTFSIVINAYTKIWEPEAFQILRSMTPEINKRAQTISASLLNELNDSLFHEVVQISAEEEEDTGEKQRQMRDWFSSRTGIEENYGVVGFGFLQALLGLGKGLTPAGDDFIGGYLLVCSYQQSGKSEDTEKLVELAYQKTTSLSANLIACAVQGEADERLLNILRFLATGEGGLEEIREELLSYGSSSGIDSLAGMLIALYQR